MTYVWMNDLHLIPMYMVLLLVMFIVLLTAIVWHELGHMIYFKHIGKEIRVFFKRKGKFSFTYEAGQLSDYVHLTDRQYANVCLSGVVGGLIPIFVITVLFSSFPMWLMVIPYTVGSWNDIKTYVRVMEDEDTT